MTIQINRGQQVAGLDAKVLRDFLRKFHTGFNQEWMIKDLKVSAWKAGRIIGALLREQYIEPEESWQKRVRAKRWYHATIKGKELMRASAANRVTRKTAQMSLDAFMRRVNEVNRDPRYLCYITKVVVFGSFLKNVDRLGDVDVAVDMDYRIPRDKNLWKAVQKYRLVLKARKRTIRIESWYSFTQMEKTPDFRYEVLLGDKRAIRHELEEADREREKHSAKNQLES